VNGRTYGRTDGHLRPALLSRLGEVDLKHTQRLVGMLKGPNRRDRNRGRDQNLGLDAEARMSRKRPLLQKDAEAKISVSISIWH